MRRLSGIAIFVGLVVLGATARVASACPRGYESWIRLAKGAHHVAEVEVLSTEDVTLTTERSLGTSGGPRTYERARARVRVVAEPRGRLPVRELTLVGGPYDSCAPYPMFLRFDAGAHLTLFLADPVPPGTVEIIVWWRGRVARLDGEGLARVIGAGTAAWERRLALLRRLAPKDMVAAAKVVATRGADGDWPSDVLRALPYPVLAGLAELERDPTRPWRPVSASDAPATPATPTSYDAGRDKGSPFTPRLAAELDRRRAADAKEKADVMAFHRAALTSWLTVELGQPAARAARFVASVSENDWLREVVPLDGLRGEPNADRELHSIAVLLDLACDEPDALVWQQFSIAVLEPAVFAPWLRTHVKELPTDGPYLDVMLAVRSPEAAPPVEREFADAGDDWRMDDFLAFFVAVGDRPHADEVVRRLTKLVDAATAPSADAKQRETAASSARWTLEAARKAVAELGAPGTRYLPPLDALLARLPK